MRVVFVCLYSFIYKINCIFIDELLHANIYLSTNLKLSLTFTSIGWSWLATSINPIATYRSKERNHWHRDGRTEKNSGSPTGELTQGLWYCAPVPWARRYHAAAANYAEYSTSRCPPMSALHCLVTGMLQSTANSGRHRKSIHRITSRGACLCWL